MFWDFLKNKRFIVGLNSLFLISNGHAVFVEAIDWPVSRFQRVTENIRGIYDEVRDTFMEEEGRGGRWKQEITCPGLMWGNERLGMVESNGGVISVSFKGAELFSRPFWNYFSLQRGSLSDYEGQVHQGFANLYIQIAPFLRDLFQNNLNQEDQEPIEFVFSGYGAGGALALCAAADFACWQKDNLLPNQVKAITFSAPKVVDDELKQEMHAQLGQKNIIQFINRLDITTLRPLTYTNVGLPIYILPSEQMRDTYYNSDRWFRFWIRALFLGGSLWGARKALQYGGQSSDAEVETGKNGALAPFLALEGGAGALLFRNAPVLPSDATIEQSVHYTRVNVENAGDGDIPEDAGEIGLFNMNRSLFMRFLKRCYRAVVG